MAMRPATFVTDNVVTIEIKHLQELIELRFGGFEDRMNHMQVSMAQLAKALDRQTQVVTDLEVLKLRVENQSAQVATLIIADTTHVGDIVALKGEMASIKPVRAGAVTLATLAFGALVTFIVAKIMGQV